MQSNILTYEERCTGCYLCLLHCSFAFTKTFNPAESMIQIEGEYPFKITFTDNCNGCGICVRICPYEALDFVK